MNAPVRLGEEFRVNTTTLYGQQEPSVAMLEDGGFVVTWSSMSQDGDNTGIFAQRYDQYGDPVGSEFQVNSYTTGEQDRPVIAALEGGGFVIVWRSDGADGDSYGISGQRYGADGLPDGTEFTINTTTTSWQFDPDVTAVGGGGFLVTWQSVSGADPSGWGTYAQLFDDTGAQVSGETLINTETDFNQESPATADLANGAVIVWASQHQDGSGWGIYGQRFDANGAPAGGEFPINATTADEQAAPDVAGLEDGGFVVVWRSFAQDGSGYGVYGQRYDASGNAVGGEFAVNTHVTDDQLDPVVTALADGGYVVVWSSMLQDGFSHGVYGQRYDAAGNPDGGEFLINTFVSGQQYQPAITAMPDGGFLVTWTSDGQDGSGFGVHAQRFTTQDLSFTIYADAAGYQDWQPLTGSAVDPVGTPTDTLVVWPNDDGTVTWIIGENFTYDPVTGEPTGGTILAIEHRTANGLTLLGSGIGMNTPLVDGYALLSSDAPDALDAFFEAVFGDRDFLVSDDPDDTELGVGEGDDILVAGSGNDILDGGAGADHLDGRGSGTAGDTVTYEWSPEAVFADLGIGEAVGGDGEGDTLVNIENLVGSAHNDGLRGDGGANRLDGGGGNDWLQGAGGADTLNGGADNDWFVFDGAVSNAGDVIEDRQNADVVYFGGTAARPTFSVSGADVLVNGVRLIGAAGGNVSVITQASAALLTADPATIAALLAAGTAGLSAAAGAFDLHQFDADNNETWTTKRDSYTAGGALDYKWTWYDAGQSYHSSKTDYDQDGAATWSTIVSNYSAMNVLDLKWTYYDAGQTYFAIKTDYDQASATNWDTIVTYYKTAGVIDWKLTTYDPGELYHSIKTDYDQDGTQTWDSVVTYYSAANVQDFRWTYYDAGQAYYAAKTDYDQSNAGTWDNIVYNYAAPGVLDNKWTYYDAGQTYYVVQTDYDQAGAETWTRVMTYYRTPNVVDLKWTYYDAGEEAYAMKTDYDQDGLYSWSNIQTTYSALNVADYRWTFYDAGQPNYAQKIDYDQDDAYWWDQHITLYDTPGHVAADYYI